MFPQGRGSPRGGRGRGRGRGRGNGHHIYHTPHPHDLSELFYTAVQQQPHTQPYPSTTPKPPPKNHIYKRSVNQQPRPNYNARQDQYKHYQKGNRWKKNKQQQQQQQQPFINQDLFSQVNPFQSPVATATPALAMAQTNQFAQPMIPGIAPTSAVQNPILSTPAVVPAAMANYSFGTGMADPYILTPDDGSAITTKIQHLVYEANYWHHKLFYDLLPDIESKYYDEQTWATHAVWRWVEIILRNYISVLRQNDSMMTTGTVTPLNWPQQR